MDWFLLAIGSAVLWSVSQALNKKALLSEHSLSFSAGYAIALLVFSIPLLLLADFTPFSTTTLAIMYASSVFSTIALWLLAKGTKHMELSASSPLLITSVLFVPIVAFFVIGEKLALTQLAGILLIFAGVLFLESLVVHSSFLPFSFHKNQYFYDLLIAAFLMSLAAVADKIVITTVAAPYAFLIIIHFLIAVNTVILLLVFDHNFKKDLGQLVAQDLKITAASAALSVVSGVLFLAALSQSLVSLTIAVKRLQSLFSVFLGGKFFHEDRIKEKAAATLIMVIGALLLALS